MGRSAIWISLIFGLFLLFLGAILHVDILAFIGLVIFLGSLFVILRMVGILRKEQVWDNWGILIEDGQGRAEEIFQGIRNFIEESQAPSLRIKVKKMAPSQYRLGEKREFLEITDFDNPRLKPYQIYINARDYGQNLDISWYLTFRPTFWQALFSPLKRKSDPTEELDLFDLQDLRAYVTNVHHCLLKAVEKLMLELDQDPSKIDKKSKGFLGVS